MALVLQPAPVHNMPRSWKGDDDMLVDRLIAASRMKEVAPESLVERTLVPYFDSSDACSYQSLQQGHRALATKPVAVPGGLKRHANERSNGSLSGSPPRKEGEVLQAKHARRGGKPAAAQPSGSAGSASTTSGSRHGSGSGSDTEMTSPLSSTRKPRSSGGKKHQRDAAGAAKPAPSGGSGSAPRLSPLSKRPEPAAINMRQLAAASAAASSVLRTPGSKGSAPRAPFSSKFAGPAFTNSPTPDCLPIPTSSLLLAEAAESLRSRLTL